ncbi:MAG: Tol-pal system protein [Microvirga sp.]|jgi:tol-pal system protein YbgF|nr:Tol-pal system protein [Microvirga sp.]
MSARLSAALFIASALAGPAAAQDASEFVVRLNRLENQVRQMSGHIEQLQYENGQLKAQLRKFQEDVEFRFQERPGAPRSAGPAAAHPQAAPPVAQPGAAPGRPPRRGDAFDPAAAPNAPGAPAPLGTTQPSVPIANPGTVAGLTPGAAQMPRGAIDSPPPGGPAIVDDDDDAPPRGAGAPLDLSAGRMASAAPPPVAAPPPPPGASIAATGSGNARADYNMAYAYIMQRQYEQAEMGLRQFLQSHPRDRLVPDAIYWLGETYLQRNRPREAAEQFLRISTEHARAAKAPEAMLKLGISLNALGARDQACATFAELSRKYPDASNNVRQGVEREVKRARCV